MHGERESEGINKGVRGGESGEEVTSCEQVVDCSWNAAFCVLQRELVDMPPSSLVLCTHTMMCGWCLFVYNDNFEPLPTTAVWLRHRL